MQVLMTPAKSAALLRLLASVKHLPGAVVELGVFEGGTLKALAEAAPEKPCFGFDTFAGMPSETMREGEFHQPGEFLSNMEDVAREMPGNVTLVKGLFPGSAKGAHGNICFAHVDLDHGKGTADAIDWLLPLMVPGGVVVFDDWHWKNCPGVAVAIEAAGLQVVESAPCQCYWSAP